jgi:hypothetical protein
LVEGQLPAGVNNEHRPQFLPENFPIRVPVFVMLLAELKAKPDANYMNAQALSNRLLS